MPKDLNSLFGLAGKKALVTGSSRGIGRAIAHGLSAAGAGIVLHARTDAALTAVKGELEELGRPVWTVARDLAERGSGKELLAEAEQLTGGLDILVVNAAAQINASLQDLDTDDLETHFHTNLRSTVEMLQVCLPAMAARGWGRVVSVGSINQARPKASVTAYAATKAAQHNLMQSQAREYARSGVLLNTLAPGLVDTDRNPAHSYDEKAREEYLNAVNWMGRAGQPEEMVGAALFLASDACSFMTGETIFVTGGV